MSRGITDPEDMADYRHCDRSNCYKSEHIPLGRKVRRPAWASAATNSAGGKARLGGISKRGDNYLRRLLVNSAHTAQSRREFGRRQSEPLNSHTGRADSR
jgi:hypothetical protein